ncbi:response regulator [Emticicia soli]|uniref:Response regulator n=1 Tax=Emticicia soli TaxID=2027878 RepID=A0ABW5J5B9_9BACT
MIFSNILLIDDDEDDQEIFQSAVQQISTSVQYKYLNSAREALQKLSSGEVSPEVIFLDLNMPLMSGQEFLGQIKQNELLSTIPVIIFSTSSDPTTKELTKHLGAHDFITKPSDFDQLVDLLKPLIR